MSTGTAENLLQRLQQALGDAETQAGEGQTRRSALRATERTYGPHVTRFGRQLHDLVCGSHAWSLFERARVRGRLPRIHELSQCEPLLQMMRESGELSERERLLRERDEALVALWQQQTDLTDSERWLRAETLHAAYSQAVQQMTASYRPFYRALLRTTGEAAPLGGPRVRTLPLLFPPLLLLLFEACHRASDTEEAVYSRGLNKIHLQPLASPEDGTDSAPLDALTWDLAVLAIGAFFARTAGDDPDAAFPVLLDDYSVWRRLDPRKRTPALRRQIEARLTLLCSDRLCLHSAQAIWQPDPETGQRRRLLTETTGPFLLSRGRFFCRPPSAGEKGQDAADGFLLSLGDWARTLVTHKAMRGVALRRLAEYDLQRQQWERRIGWYLTFQMHCQAPRMTVRKPAPDDKPPTEITPQHPLKMHTVLDNSHIDWRKMAQTNPGKVIRQWTDALATLQRDGIIGPCRCLEGPLDGSDLPPRGRLAAMLTRRYEFIPGRDLRPHLRIIQGQQRRRSRG